MKVAVVGAGHLGRVHVRTYGELPEVELVGVVDTDRAVADEVADSVGTRAFYDHRDLIGLAEAVSVVVPTQVHYPVARDLLDAGIHLIVEKPMTMTAEEAEDLVLLANRRRVALQVGHVERFNPAVVAVRPYVHDPRYIECDRISPFSFRSIDVGVVLDMMIHDLDIVMAFVNSEPAEIEGAGVAVFGRHEDMASARIGFENGCVAYLRASRISDKRLRKIRIFQADSYISVNYAERRAQVFRRKRTLTEDELASLPQRYPRLEDAQRYMFDNLLDISEVPIREEEPLRMELKAFVEAVRGGAEPPVPGELGLRTMRLAARVLDSISEVQNAAAIPPDKRR